MAASTALPPFSKISLKELRVTHTLTDRPKIFSYRPISLQYPLSAALKMDEKELNRVSSENAYTAASVYLPNGLSEAEGHCGSGLN